MMQITIIGFGNQAKSWALNLKDSNFKVTVALRKNSSSIKRATDLGFSIQYLEEKLQGDYFCLLTPDHTHQDFFNSFKSSLPENAKIIYAHGYSVLTHKLEERYPNFTHLLLAPKSIGSELRAQFVSGGDLGGVYSVEHSSAPEMDTKHILEISKGLGLNLGPYKATFEHETRADLFSEQGILCSMIPYMASEMYDQLIAKGIEPELAYFECWYELKLIVKTMVDIGPQKFFDLISPNALIGSEKGFQKLITPDLKEKLRDLYTDIENNQFDTEIKNTNLEVLRKTISSRWANSGLMKAHQLVQKESK